VPSAIGRAVSPAATILSARRRPAVFGQPGTAATILPDALQSG